MLLIAVSGGIDSCVLVRLLLEGGYRFAIAHMNFGLRGLESDDDQDFVEHLAANSHCVVHTKRVNLMDPEWDGSIQMRARQARYQWLDSLVKEHGYFKIVTAHHGDDHLETLLLQLGRGGKIDSLGGIKQQHGLLVRPLLFATRQEIVEYAKKNGIKWREDSSNKEDKYQRNYIRHHIATELKELFPSIQSALQGQYQRNQLVLDFLQDQLKQASQRYCSFRSDQILVDKSLLQHPQAALILQYVLEPYGFSFSRILEILASTTTGSNWQTSGYQCWNDRQHWIIRPIQTSQDLEYSLEVNTHQLEFGPGFGLACSFTTREDFAVSDHIAWLNGDKLTFPLTLRPAKEGDRMQPLGMDGSKKVSDLLIDMKVSRADKEHVWVIESAGEIAWVIGYRISHKFRLLPDTKQVYKLIFQNSTI